MDKRAKKILFQTYWKNGWIDKKDRKITHENFLYAKEKGVMFEPFSISHDDCVIRIIELAKEISQDEIVRAFLSSLSARRLELRSGIASWYVAKQFTAHKYTPVKSGQSYNGNGEVTHTSYTCGVCKDIMYGVIGWDYYKDEDLSVLNFERIKWGGVRHGELLYTLFDLEQFQKEEISNPTDEGIAIFQAILKTIDDSNEGDYPSKLRDRLKDIAGLKSNKDELSTLIELLACIGVLKPASYNRPEKGKHDWTYATHWRGEDKYDKVVARQLFGEFIG
ncbi:MAG: hypothetical protein FWD48_05425 [Oscillospiraceae bacterium]|nr:hypothetical protein [Oscillospiraceae bacterium]